jgi:hypothetical protein
MRACALCSQSKSSGTKTFEVYFIVLFEHFSIDKDITIAKLW